MIYIAVVSAYVLLLFAISVYKRRSVRSDDDFIVAGRSVPVYVLVATLVCTWTVLAASILSLHLASTPRHRRHNSETNSRNSSFNDPSYTTTSSGTRMTLLY